MAAVIENRLGSYEKRKEQIRRYELFIETNQTEETAKKPRLAIESKKSKYKIRFPDGCVFLAACSSGSTDDVAELLKNPNTDINTTNVDGLTGLHQACINEDLDMVKFLVNKGIDINMRDNEGWTALHAAAQSGFVEIAKFLIGKGAKLDIINCDCELPLDLSQCKEMTHLLEEAMKAQGVDGDKARNAEERIMMEDIKKWSESGTYDGIVDEKTGASPLHVAAVKGYLEIMKELMRLGAPVDAKDNEGWTPMHGAAHWGQEEACRLLAENFCDLRAVNHQGCTPLDVADPNVVELLEELLEKQKWLPETSNVSRPSKTRKSSITRISAGHMKDLQRKNEEDEKPPTANFALVEDEDSLGDSDQNKISAKDRPIGEVGQSNALHGDGEVISKLDKGLDHGMEGVKSDNMVMEKTEIKPDEVLSEDRIQFLLEERKRKVCQQRASDSNVVVMRRDTPRPKTFSEISRPPRQIASDLVRRSGDPSLWRLGFRRSSNSETDFEDIIQQSEIEQEQEEFGETDEDKELKKSGEQSPDSQVILEPTKEIDRPAQQPSLLRPETAAALATIASSHQRPNDSTKRDDANELERKLKAKRARESRRSTQGVTKEDIQRAEDTLRAAHHQSLPIASVVETLSTSSPEGGSGDVDADQHFSPPPLSSVSSGTQGAMIDLSVDTLIEKWQKKDGDGKIDLRTPQGSRSSVQGASSSVQKKDYSLPDTLTLYRKICDQSESSQKETLSQQPPSTGSETSTKSTESGEDSTVKSAALRARRKRENRRSTGKISLDGVEVQISDPEETEDTDQAVPQMIVASSSHSITSMSTAPIIGSQKGLDSLSVSTVSSTLPKAIPSTTSLSLSSTSNSLTRYSSSRLQDPTGASPSRYSSLSSRDRWSNLTSSWQNQSPRGMNLRSSAILSSYDSLSSASNFRTGSSGTNSALPIDYQKLLEQEKLENENLRKRISQLERDLRNARLQFDVNVATPSKGFDRIDAMEKRSVERKLSEVEEEKKILEKKLAGLEEELQKIEPIKIENTKLKSENAALIRVISKLSK